MYNIGFATQSQILENYKNIMEMWKIFFLCCCPSAIIIQFCGSSFAEFSVSGCLIMMSLFRSSLLLCSLLRQLADLSSIHDAVFYSKTLCSLHITHIIIITMCIIIVILIFFRGYIVNSAMKVTTMTTSFKAL